MAKLVVFGATGFAGSRITDEALHRRHEVIAVARRPGSGVVTGSLYEEHLVAQLTSGADVLVCAITSGPDEHGRTMPDAIPILVAAAQRNRVRLGIVGGAGSLLLTEGGEQVVTKLTDVAPPDKLRDIRLHGEFLDALRAAPGDVDWFYLSPPVGFGAHVQGERLGHYRVGGDVLLTDEQGNAAISGEDYAIAFLDEIENPRHHRQRFTVAY